jgi:ATP-dependent Clp protease adaptor protein ClpS
MIYQNQPGEEFESDVLLESAVTSDYEIVLYNDDVNTFEHVINCLIKYCNHNPQQAEQCAWIVHNNGKCSIKTGEYKLLEPICTALLNQGLSAQIELI